jgi:hypothetical protein
VHASRSDWWWGASPVTPVRKRKDAMGLFEKSLWSEDARQPFCWSSTGAMSRSPGRCCLLEKGDAALRVGQFHRPGLSQGFEHRFGLHTDNRRHFEPHTEKAPLPVALATPARQRCKSLRIHTEMPDHD